MFKKATYCMIVLSSISLPAFSANLADILAYTYENSGTINANRAGLKAVDEEIAKAKSGYRPQVYANASIGRSYYKYHYMDGVYDTNTAKLHRTPDSLGVSMVQPVFSGLSTVNNVSAAKETVKSERSNLYSVEQLTLLDATNVYMNVIRDKAVLELQENNEKILQKHLDSYQKKFKAGQLTKTDVSQSKARLSGAKAATIAARGQLKVSKAQYTSVVGKIVENQMDDVVVNESLLPSTLEEAITMAMETNPAIKSINYELKASNYNVKSKKGALSPNIDIKASAAKQHNIGVIDESNTWDLSANLSVPIYQSGAEYADIRSAKQLENQLRILSYQIKDNVRAQTISSFENYAASKAQVKAIETQIQASKIALDGVIREESVGARTVLDVLDAEQEYLDNQVLLVKTHRDQVVAAYTLLADIGYLNPAHLNLNVDMYNPDEYYKTVENKWF